MQQATPPPLPPTSHSHLTTPTMISMELPPPPVHSQHQQIHHHLTAVSSMSVISGGGGGGGHAPFSPEQLHYTQAGHGTPTSEQQLVGEGDIITFGDDMNQDGKRKRKSFDKSKFTNHHKHLLHLVCRPARARYHVTYTIVFFKSHIAIFLSAMIVFCHSYHFHSLF